MRRKPTEQEIAARAHELHERKGRSIGGRRSGRRSTARFARGYDSKRNTFRQSYDRHELDASLLMIPLVGFLSAHDERVAGTVQAIERELLHGGSVLRYRTESGQAADGLPAGEGVFLACSFWLADAYAQS
jgi:GH15 family glucan-1,4-alpha-glucosidase